MPYIDIKTINGRRYKYLRESVRLKNGRVIHRNVKYLGPAEPVYGRKNGKPDTIRAEGKLRKSKEAAPEP
jgi:hypothetical protein